jgi:hypothetical protein
MAAAAMVLLAVTLFRSAATAPEPKADSRMSTDVVDMEQVDRSLADLEMLRQFGVELEPAGAAPSNREI